VQNLERKGIPKTAFCVYFSGKSVSGWMMVAKPKITKRCGFVRQM
jgi:hypothetical protein